MPVVYSEEQLEKAGITIPPVDPKGCIGCPAHERGAFAALYYKEPLRPLRSDIDGPSVGEVCREDRLSRGGTLSCHRVVCVRVENHTMSGFHPANGTE